MIEQGYVAGGFGNLAGDGIYQPPPAAPSPLPQQASDPISLEQRVGRLEDTVAVLADTSALEARVTERVIKELQRERSQNAPIRRPQESALATGLSKIPVSWFARHLGVLYDAYDEFRSMWRMFLDPAFRLSWTARFIPLMLTLAILTSWIWLPGTWLLPTSVATLYDKIVDVVLAFFAYRVLSSEARRYRN